MSVIKWIKAHGSDKGFQPGDLGEPTNAPPGSAKKARVLIERIRDGRPLFHPDDAPLGGLTHDPNTHGNKGRSRI